MAAVDDFNNNIVRIRNLHALYLTLSATTTLALDLSDLLRAEIVLLGSALDHYVHEVTRSGIIESWRNNRPKTSAFLRFPASLESVSQAAAGQADAWLEKEIRSRHGYLSFQQPDKIADAIRLFCDKELWSEVANILGVENKSLKIEISLIVDRRNKIAHEADLDPSYPGLRWPISPQDTSNATKTIEEVVLAIDQVVHSP